MTQKKVYSFEEKTQENGYPVWQSPRYLASKTKAIEMIESDKYGLNESDFWILKNLSRNKQSINYVGLIISHNGCLKINDALEDKDKFNPNNFHIEKSDYTGGLIGIYQDDSLIEYGEITRENCKNAYPYAMLLKRTFDRVVLKKSKLAYAGVYSDSEAEEFKEPNEDKVGMITTEQMDFFGKVYGDQLDRLLEANNINYLSEMTYDKAKELIDKITNKKSNVDWGDK